MEKLTLAEINTAVSGRLESRGNESVQEQEIEAVSTDTRSLPANSLFIPLIGERFDGHDFVPNAVDQGAKAVLIDERHWKDGLHPPVPAIIVADTLAALGDLAAYYRRRFPLRTVGITGSNGKTTTKDMVAAVFAQKWPTLATQGNFNNEVGLPLTLFRLQSEHRALVVEMGMRGKGQIARLAQIAAPQIGIVTNVGTVHAELLGSIEGIAEAKAELVDALPADGVAVLNADDPRVRAMKSRISSYLLFGIDSPADITARDIEEEDTKGIAFTMSYQNVSHQVHLPVIGKHNVLNALAAAGAAFAAGLGWEEVLKGLASFEQTEMRMEVSEQGSVRIINDAYNASPESMQAALDTAASLAQGRNLVLVLGDMLELGERSTTEHKNIGEKVRAISPRHLVTVGQLAGQIGETARGAASFPVDHFPDSQGAAEYVLGIIRPGDTVLVKGSRGVALEKVVQALQANLPGRKEGR